MKVSSMKAPPLVSFPSFGKVSAARSEFNCGAAHRDEVLISCLRCSRKSKLVEKAD